MKFLFLTLTLFFGFLSTSQAVEFEAVFNTPGFRSDETQAVDDELVSLIDAALSGATIRLAEYRFNRPEVAKALLRASARGCDVRLVIDGGNRNLVNKPDEALYLLAHGQDGQQLTCKDKPCITFCKSITSISFGGDSFGGSCAGIAINHNKFAIFSALNNGDHDVVLQTSSNLANGMLHMYNDALVMKNDPVIYEAYRKYWNYQQKDQFHFNAYPTEISNVRGDVKMYFFPRMTGRDPVLDLLNRVDCHLPGSTIRAAQAAFTRGEVAARMHALSQQGCDVKVMARIDPKQFSPSDSVKRNLGKDLILLPYQGKKPEEKSKNSIHTKIVLIDAALDGAPDKIQLVLTGSHNLDLFSLRTNDEVLLQIKNTELYETYLDFWNQILADYRRTQK